MTSKNIANVARPILSTNKNEARARALRLYKYWFRTIDFIACYYKSNLQLTIPMMRKKLREEFDKNRHHTDLRVIDLLLFKSQNDIREITNLWAQENHIINNWWKDTVDPRPDTFLKKFFIGSD